MYLNVMLQRPMAIVEGGISPRLAAAMSWPALSYRALGSTTDFDWSLIDLLCCMPCNGRMVVHLDGWTARTSTTCCPMGFVVFTMTLVPRARLGLGGQAR